jgi:hypothetical protein
VEAEPSGIGRRPEPDEGEGRAGRWRRSTSGRRGGGTRHDKVVCGSTEGAAAVSVQERGTEDGARG